MVHIGVLDATDGEFGVARVEEHPWDSITLFTLITGGCCDTDDTGDGLLIFRHWFHFESEVPFLLDLGDFADENSLLQFGFCY